MCAQKLREKEKELFSKNEFRPKRELCGEAYLTLLFQRKIPSLRIVFTV